jgi:hypothetical protein
MWNVRHSVQGSHSDEPACQEKQLAALLAAQLAAQVAAPFSHVFPLEEIARLWEAGVLHRNKQTITGFLYT